MSSHLKPRCLKCRCLSGTFLPITASAGLDAAKALLNEAEDQFQAIHESLRDIQQLNVGQENIDMAEEFDKAVTDYQKGCAPPSPLLKNESPLTGIEQQLRDGRPGAGGFFPRPRA